MCSSKSLSATVYYNGACPICSTEINHYMKLDRRNGAHLEFVDIAGYETVCPFDRTEMLKRLHVVDASGNKHVGVDAFIELWSHMPYYRVLARIAGRPFIKQRLVALYDRTLAPWLFNRHIRRDAQQRGNRSRYFSTNRA
jgi:predicted DCC family thiol-disulfide oxidoreductase YuxK